MRYNLNYFFLFAFFLFFSSCAKPTAEIPIEDPLPDSVAADDGRHTQILIYGGPGSWKSEIASVKNILKQNQVSYEVALPKKVNALSAEEFAKYRAVIFVGGDAPTVRNALTKESRAQLRLAVRDGGLNYLGFCAGAWIAVAPTSSVEEDASYGLGVVNGPLQEFNHLSRAGLKHALDQSIFPDGSRRNLLWWGGPVTPTIPGGVIAKYSDGTPAITQIESGRGLVIVSGFHPAATEGILDKLNLSDREAIAPELAWKLLDAVINKKRLPAFP